MSQSDAPNPRPPATGGRLEALLGRALGVDDTPLPPLESPLDAATSAARPRSPRSRSRRVHRRARVGRGRAIAAGALVVALAGAWLVAARAARTDAEPARALPRSSRPSEDVAVTSPARTLRALVPAGADCVERRAPDPLLQCTLEGVTVEYGLPGPARVADVYRRVIADAAVPHQGPPACASGGADERAWSRPDAPDAPVGRYVCALEGGRAAIWWTSTADGLIAHALGPDADLAALFTWWRTHGERTPPH